MRRQEAILVYFMSSKQGKHSVRRFGLVVVISLGVLIWKWPFTKLTGGKQWDSRIERQKDMEKQNQYGVFKNMSASTDLFTGHKYICKILIGRLGNHMFQYASVYGIAKRKGMVPMINSDAKLDSIFHMRGRTQMGGKGCQDMRIHYEKRCSAYDIETVSFSAREDVQLMGYLQSFRYFAGYEKEIRSQFTFQQHIIKKAEQVLEGYFGNSSLDNVRKNSTLVAIHVRRGDKAGQRSWGSTVAPREYIINARNYFIEKYNNPVFITCSDAISWCEENIPHNGTIFIENQKSEVDLAIMTMCDHVIMTVGTFGWWAAWLANGETIYYKKRFEPGSTLSECWNLTDHYPSSWIAML